MIRRLAMFFAGSLLIAQFASTPELLPWTGIGVAAADDTAHNGEVRSGGVPPKALEQISSPRTVRPLQETYMKGWRERSDNCQTTTLGGWTIITAPARGTLRTAIVSGPSSECPGTHDFNTLYYTWTDRAQGQLQDQFVAQWDSPSDSKRHFFTLTLIPPEVSISSADIRANRVSVTLTGSGPSASAGRLTVRLIGANNEVSVPANGGAVLSAGTHTVSFNRPAIPIDIYSRVTATWSTAWAPILKSFTITPSWKVLGVKRHTQYNTPTETSCSGGTRRAWLFDRACNFTQVQLNSQFFTAVKDNGSGKLPSGQLIKSAYSQDLCSGKFPNGERSISFLKVAQIDGACLTVITPQSQAVFPHPRTDPAASEKCGNTTVLVTGANANKDVRNVADLCPICKNTNRIDNYSTLPGCTGNSVGDLGDFWTVNIQ